MDNTLGFTLRVQGASLPAVAEAIVTDEAWQPVLPAGTPDGLRERLLARKPLMGSTLLGPTALLLREQQVTADAGGWSQTTSVPVVSLSAGDARSAAAARLFERLQTSLGRLQTRCQNQASTSDVRLERTVDSRIPPEAVQRSILAQPKVGSLSVSPVGEGAMEVRGSDGRPVGAIHLASARQWHPGARKHVEGTRITVLLHGVSCFSEVARGMTSAALAWGTGQRIPEPSAISGVD